MESPKFGNSHLSLFKAIGFDQEAMALITKIFYHFTSSADGKMSNIDLTNFLKTTAVVRDVNRADHYFRAFDDRYQGYLSLNQFIAGLAAMDPSVEHGREFAELRCRFIFRFYCTHQQQERPIMAWEDYRSMCCDIVVAKNRSLEDKPDAARKFASNLYEFYESDFDQAKFKKLVGTLTIRGTSELFRAQVPVLKCLRQHLPLLRVKKEQPEAMDTSGPSVTRRNCAMQTEPDFEVSHLAVGVTTSGLVLERITDMKDVAYIDDEIPATVSQRSKSTMRKQQDSEANLDRARAVTCANEILRALDFFYHPYNMKQRPTNPCENRVGGRNQENENPIPSKPPLDWSDIKMSKLAMCIIKLCRSLQPVLAAESRCLQLQQPIYVLGDIHGNYEDLHQFERLFWPMGPENSASNILCLGDYVDRGQYGLEVVAYLFALKLLAPKKVYLLRGNHELREQQKEFQFKNECSTKLREYGEAVWEDINRCFEYLPVAAIIDNKIFCVHGGIPHPRLIHRTEQDLVRIINQAYPCPAITVPVKSLGWELMWNDPVWSGASKLDSEGFCSNISRGTGHEFSNTALDNFLHRFGLSHLIRAHQVQAAGFQLCHRTRCLTVFSTSMYSGLENEAAVAFVNDGVVKLIRLTLPDRNPNSSKDTENGDASNGECSYATPPPHKKIGIFARR